MKHTLTLFWKAPLGMKLIVFGAIALWIGSMTAVIAKVFYQGAGIF